ncbi:MAG: 1-deoxy-D-xylulose-5-phosphate reductoisomerase, partial [Dehalococcoidales bacterium]|nr:1-deoxy-D-xylulose-5-phosphate reductoisomerase [Dehalococcoidales bacterium]
NVDIVVVATSGKAGLAPSFSAVRAGKRLALANKEVLVMAGALLEHECRHRCSTVYPVDSEHSAIWQCLLGETACHDAAASEGTIGLCGVPPVARRLILTASGGAFRDVPLERLNTVTPEEALRHPTWLMGPRITIDSATMVNKGLEIIEARWLFGMDYDRIEVVIHRESVIHSMVEFFDGTAKAELSVPDMRFPIQFALTHPERWDSTLPSLDFTRLGNLTFEPVDYERYPGLALAIEAGRRGGTYPAVLAAADEVAVGMFLDKAIGFLDITRLIDNVLQDHSSVAEPTLADILAADHWARQRCRQLAGV